MNKRSIVVFLLTFILLLLGGCSGKAGPEGPVETYLSAAQKLDLETMAATILPSNTGDITKTTNLMGETEDVNYAKYFLDYLKANAKKMTFKIVKSEVNGDKAIVTVDCKYVDGGPLLEATIREVLIKTLGNAFSGKEATDEETSQIFASAMKEQSKTINETYKEAAITINCIKQDGKWYISETNDELLDVVMSGLISVGKDISKNFNMDSKGTEDNSGIDVTAEDPAYVLSEIQNYVVGDLWNDGFCEISTYLQEGTGSTGQVLDIDFTKSQLDKAMMKKPGYDEYIAGLDAKYADIKDIWNKLSSEIDALYTKVKNGATELNTDLFNQYMSAFSDAVYELK